VSTNIFITGLRELRRRAQEAMEAARLQYLQQLAVKKAAEQLLPPPATPINELLEQRLPDIRSLLKNPKPIGRRDGLGLITTNTRMPVIEVTRSVVTGPIVPYLPFGSGQGFTVTVQIQLNSTDSSTSVTKVLSDEGINTRREGDLSVYLPDVVVAATVGLELIDSESAKAVIDDYEWTPVLLEANGGGTWSAYIGVVKYKQTQDFTYTYSDTRGEAVEPEPGECAYEPLPDGAVGAGVVTQTRVITSTFETEYTYHGWLIGRASIEEVPVPLEKQTELRSQLRDFAPFPIPPGSSSTSQTETYGDWFYDENCFLVQLENVEGSTDIPFATYGVKLATP
jgi:hypothetical protein